MKNILILFILLLSPTAHSSNSALPQLEKPQQEAVEKKWKQFLSVSSAIEKEYLYPFDSCSVLFNALSSAEVLHQQPSQTEQKQRICSAIEEDSSTSKKPSYSRVLDFYDTNTESSSDKEASLIEHYISQLNDTTYISLDSIERTPPKDKADKQPNIQISFIEDTTLLVRINELLNSSANDIKKELSSITRKKDIRKIIIDLRFCQGGLVTAGIAISDLFIDEKSTILHIKGKTEDNKYTASSQNILPNTEILLLIDENTAGAAEVFTGAMLDAGRAKAIGSITHGLKHISNINIIPGNFVLKKPMAHYYRASGKNLADGITPTICYEKSCDRRSLQDEPIEEILRQTQ